MVAIWDVEELQDLEVLIRDGFQRAKADLIDDEDVDSSLVQRFGIDSIWVIGEWANNRAESGETLLDTAIVYTVQGAPNPSQINEILDVANEFQIQIAGVLNGQMVETPDTLQGLFGGFNIRLLPFDRKEDGLQFSLGRGEGNRVFSLDGLFAVEFRENVAFGRLPRIPLEQLRGPEEVEEEEETEPDDPDIEVEDDETVFEAVEEALSQEELLAQEFPDVPEQLRKYATGPDTLEIKSGVKDTKTVEPRGMYPFEVVMMTNREQMDVLPMERDETVRVSEVAPGIGQASSGTVNAFTREEPLVGLDLEPPATYPRTGNYIRNYLKFEGPAYALQMYKEFLVYLGYVNSWYVNTEGDNYDLSIGTYESFREYLYVLQEIPERTDAPELIIPLSQPQASSRGLETIPDHPTLEGEKAPWLARRQWYEIDDEGFNHPAWRNAYDFLHKAGDE